MSDRLVDLEGGLDDRLSDLPGRFRPLLMVDLWVALLWYSGGWPSHHPLLVFMQETENLVGLRWWRGSAWAADDMER